MKIKNLFLGTLAMTSVMFATSCSQEEEGGLSNNDYVNASFTIGTPEGINSRAIGDGGTVDKIECAVFDADGNEMTALRQRVVIDNKTATYDIRLVKGQKYRVAFFAFNEAAGAYDVTDMKNITVSTDAALSNREDRDAFTAYHNISAEATMQPINEEITLYRPFAQLNIGAYTEDIEKAAMAGVVVKNSQVVVSDVYTAFNAYEDVVAGETTSMTFKMNAIPTEKLLVDTDGDDTPEEYEYLALNYLLVGNKRSEKALTDVVFTWKTEGGKTNNPVTEFKNIPVQRNYRTNILGYILTNPAKFNIVIDAEFMKPGPIFPGQKDEDYIIFDPAKMEEVTPDASTPDMYSITSVEELFWFADQVNSGKNSFSGKTVELKNNIDLTGYVWIPVGRDGAQFEGTFEGNGNDIINLYVNNTDTSDKCASGLFGFNKVCTIQNLNLITPNVTGHHNVAAVSGYQYGMISGCTVYGGTINCIAANKDADGDKCGAIVGYLGEDAKMEYCMVSDLEGPVRISAGRDAGVCAGMATEALVKGCKFSGDITVTANGTGFDGKAGENVNKAVIGRKR